MPPKADTPLTPDQVVEFWELFGCPPVLSTEDLNAYHHLVTEYVAVYQPTNALELRVVREAVDADWEGFRCGRHRTVAVERYFRNEVEARVSQLKQMNERIKGGLTHSNNEKKQQLEALSQTTEMNIAKLTQTPANEFDHNRALERGAAFLTHLEVWQNGARARRTSALQLLEYSRARATHADQKIIDAPYKEVDKPQIDHVASPTIAPAEVPDNAVTTQNSSEPAKLPQE